MSKVFKSVFANKIGVTYRPDYMLISRKWFDGGSLISIIVAILVVLTIGNEIDFRKGLHIVFYVGVISYFAYSTVADWINVSNVYVSKDLIKVEHKPIPWIGSKEINLQEVKQIYTKHSHFSLRVTRNEGYDLYVTMKNNDDFVVLGGIGNIDEALFVEREIKKYLGIEGVTECIKIGFSDYH